MTAVLRMLALAGLLASAACGSECTTCAVPVFDIAVPIITDQSVLTDLAITSAGVVMVGPGAGNRFAPATLTIRAGDSVTWNWVSGFHSIVSDSSAFPASAGQSSGQYTIAFPTAGTFPYHCGVHGPMMSATIVVQ